MKFCCNCGSCLDDDARFCNECGTPVETDEDITEQTNTPEETKNSVNIDLNKVVGSAKNVASGIQLKVDEQLAKKKAKNEEEREKQAELDKIRKQKEDEAQKRINSDSKVNETELWSWLKKKSMRKHFYSEEINTLSSDEFANKVQLSFEENSIPAVIEKRTIEWDRSGVIQQVFSIIPRTEFVNPISCLLQFNHVGNFTFVEEKTFITPPDLPEVPEKKIELSAGNKLKMLCLVYGILALIVGLLLTATYYLRTVGFLSLCVSVGLLIVGFSALAEQKKVNAHNAMIKMQELAWEKAWTDWQNNIFLHSFQEDINGQVSRIFDAAFECVELVCKDVFGEEPVLEEKEQANLNNLEEMIARRKSDYR